MAASKLVSFTQEVILNTTPEILYTHLLDSDLHSEFTGGEAIIGKKVGDSFSVFDGYATGKNVELIPNKKIVQTWYAQEDHWDPQYISEIVFEFVPLDSNQTKIVFTHSKIPAMVADQFKQGWEDFYWNPLREIFNS